MIKAVIFDWGGVLIDNPANGLVSYCANRLGIREEELIRVLGTYLPEFQRGSVSEDSLWGRVCNELGIERDFEGSLWGDAFRDAYSPKEEMFSLASDLKRRDYRTALLSNTEEPAMNHFRRQGYDMFDVTVFSCVEGTIKPESRIYQIALERLRIRPDEAVFIDDKVSYVEGARNIGINTVLFDSPKQVRDELSKLSVRAEQKY